MVDLGDWNLFGATFWTDYKKDDTIAKLVAGSQMNDHYIIHKLTKGGIFTKFKPDDALEEHNKSIAALDEALYNWKDIDKPTIVLGHHAPTYQSIHPKYGDDQLNYAYSSDLSEVDRKSTRLNSSH